MAHASNNFEKIKHFLLLGCINNSLESLVILILLFFLLVVAGLCTARMKAALSPGPQRHSYEPDPRTPKVYTIKILTIDISATDLGSLKAVTTWHGANPHQYRQ